MKGPSLSLRSSRPPLWREARFGLEAASLVRDPIFRGEGMRDGRGRAVLLVPGFLAGDGSLGFMAGWLKRAGYRPVRAGMRANVDCSGAALKRLEEIVRKLEEHLGRRATPTEDGAHRFELDDDRDRQSSAGGDAPSGHSTQRRARAAGGAAVHPPSERAFCGAGRA